MKGLGPKLRPRTPDPLAGMPGLAGGPVQWTPPPPVPVSVPDVGRDSKSVRAGHQSHVEIAVCQGKKCSKAGGGALLAAFKAAAREGGSDVTVRPCKCRDACKAAPVVEVTSDAGRMLVKRVHTSEVMRLLATHTTDADIEDSATPECPGGPG